MRRLVTLLVCLLACSVLAEEVATYNCGSFKALPSGYCDDGKTQERIAGLNEFLYSFMGPGWDSAQVEIAESFDTGLGLVAKNDIEPGRQIMFVDATVFASRFISLGVAVRQGPFPSHLNYTDPVQPFALWLLRQYIPNTFFFQYIDAMPKEFPHMPHTWTDEQIEQIQLPHVAELIKTRKADIKLGYEYAVELLKEEKHNNSFVDKNVLTFENYQWAYLAAMTRLVALGSRPDQVALIPGFDLFNHKASPNAPFVHLPQPTHPTEGYLSVQARVHYKKGDPVTIMYPAVQVANLFETYGILPDEEEPFTLIVQHDPLAIYYDMPNPQDRSETPDQLAALRNVTGETTQYSMHFDNLFVFVEVMRRLENRSATENLDALQTLDLHMDEYVRVATQLKATMKRYPTSLEHDRAKLVDAKPHTAESRALKFRVALKKLLQSGAVTFKKVRDTLDHVFEKIKVAIAAAQEAADEADEEPATLQPTTQEDGIFRLTKRTGGAKPVAAEHAKAQPAPAPAQKEAPKQTVRTEL